jgi:geranylgeranyl pyrophosphate synthase|tara:strand:- start:263 stop:1135 length:873 start_codon:yes stop_codon:yes gene_type:complete
MTNSGNWIVPYKERVNSVLESLLPDDDSILTKAISYSVLNGGKRLRPLLVYLSSELGKSTSEAQDLVSCAVELIHCYSLIHDDLPSMDDDSLRRGLPTCHKKFGEAIAILAGDALQPMAYSLLINSNEIEDKLKIKLVALLSKACGQNGMVEGQILDISDNKSISLEELDYMHSKKTGSLIKTCLEMGGLISYLQVNDINLLKEYGEKIGLAFQIRDDIIDLESPSEVSGKTQGADVLNQRVTYPKVIGMEASKKRAIELCKEAQEIVTNLSGDPVKLIKLSDFISNRHY